jgi:hypothetical protein
MIDHAPPHGALAATAAREPAHAPRSEIIMAIHTAAVARTPRLV